MTAAAIRAAYQRLYRGEPFVELTYSSIADADARLRRDHLLAEYVRELPVHERLDELADQLGILVRRREPELGAPVSLAEAARQLHISKGRTLLPAVAAGHVRTVRVGGRLKIPVDELERLAIEGVTPRRRRTQPAARAERNKPRDLAVELAQVRALRFPSRG